ncbi:uncharacterized protein LOC101850010 [Aplysia californica]|uniref:Uncharacterized protein LOC101850010 n=1 Tax=Aplysia californica TaxID=6500 RepID=A0ABM1A1U9_APLCA|nr:uncharacterized protein LOC101850010 [Aplysia californica]
MGCNTSKGAEAQSSESNATKPQPAADSQQNNEPAAQQTEKDAADLSLTPDDRVADSAEERREEIKENTTGDMSGTTSTPVFLIELHKGGEDNTSDPPETKEFIGGNGTGVDDAHDGTDDAEHRKKSSNVKFQNDLTTENEPDERQTEETPAEQTAGGGGTEAEEA